MSHKRFGRNVFPAFNADTHHYPEQSGYSSSYRLTPILVNETSASMGGIASSAYFLVSPMLAVNQPVDPDARSAIVSPAPTPVQLGVTPIVAYLPPDLDDRNTLGRIVGEQVRRQLAEQPEPVATIWSEDGTIGSGIDADEPDDHDAAVIDAHKQRIGILRERLAAARSLRGSPLLADLQKRLRRAEAARQLAVTRAEAHRLAALVAGRDVGVIAITGDPARFAARTTSTTWRIAASRDRSTERMMETPAAKRLLAHARQSLTTARAALERAPPSPHRSDAAPKIVIAGLLHWAGSDRWSLSGVERAG